MSEPIEQVAERVLRLHADADSENSVVRVHAESALRNMVEDGDLLALAREVLALRALCGAMREAVETYRGRHVNHCICSGCEVADAALASYRAHFPEREKQGEDAR